MNVTLRPARTADVVAIRGLIDMHTADRRMLAKAAVTLYEDVQEFIVAEVDGEVAGCGALHVMWRDLAEVRTLVVQDELQGRGIGSQILRLLLDRARGLGVQRVFCLTFEVEFFSGHGFEEIKGSPVEPDVYEHLLESYDEGVAEFLGLERVRPNYLGNHRMLMVLE